MSGNGTLGFSPGGPTAPTESPLQIESIVVVNGLEDRDRELVAALRAELDRWFSDLQTVYGDRLLWSQEYTREQLGGISPNYLRELADRGLVKRRYQGRRPFYEAASVRDYVASLPTVLDDDAA